MERQGRKTNQFPFKMTAPKATAFPMDTLSPIVGDLAIILAIPLAHQPSDVPFRGRVVGFLASRELRRPL